VHVQGLSTIDPSLAGPGEVEATHRPPTLECVYRLHFKQTWRVLRRLGVAEAQLDDATQDVFLVVNRKLHDFDPRAPLHSWIFAITVRVASEYRRRAARRRSEPLDDGIADRAPSPARSSEVREAIRLLEAVLEELDETKRTVFVLSELEQLSVPEIAHVIGVNVNTVYSRLRAARKRFDSALARRRASSAAGERR
jgi:RNA polymerase sigma-70 factor (ECF subfamily)